MQCFLSQNANALYVYGADEADQTVSGVLANMLQPGRGPTTAYFWHAQDVLGHPSAHGGAY